VRARPATFLLTDPVIRHARKHRPAVFGRSDHGKRGIDASFSTHTCSGVCALLALPAARAKDRARAAAARVPRRNFRAAHRARAGGGALASRRLKRVFRGAPAARGITRP